MQNKNRAKCKACGDVIESTHRHDWVACSCFKNEVDNTGIFVDGGNDYWRAGGNFSNFLRLDDDGTEHLIGEIEPTWGHLK